MIEPVGLLAQAPGERAQSECRATTLVTTWVATAHDEHVCFKIHHNRDTPHRCWACTATWLGT
jgi:hypothetical protein